jgi:rhamnosyltransferase
MTSADIVNVDAVLDIGGFDENLFIDEVDHALCFALGEKEYQIVQHTTVYVNHSLGQTHHIFNAIKRYPAFRLYYMVRNYLYLKRKYKRRHSDFFKTRRRYLLKFFMLQLLFNGEPLKSIQMFVRGVRDYQKNRFGKIDD